MLPVTILTGFLGCGKTTLLRRILENPGGLRLGILMNEKGLAGIDDANPLAVAGGFIELAQGCVCCIDQPDLIAALHELARRGNIDRVLLETTGLADPLPISWALGRPELSALVSLEAVVTAVDVANQEATRVPEWSAQVRSADVVVLTKIDLAGEEAAARARADVRADNPHARVLSADEGLLALVGEGAIFGARAAATLIGDPHVRPLARHGDFATHAIRGAGRYHADAIEDLVEDLPDPVFRAKGIVHLADGRWLAFQSVAGRAHIDFEAAPPAHGETRMIFFGRHLDPSVLEARLAAARVE